MEKTALKYGLLTTAGLILFFFFMMLIGLAYNVELRVLNLFIMFAGVYAGIRHRKHHDKKMNYLDGILTGQFTAFTAAISFAVFIFIYLMFLDPSFMVAIQQKEAFGEYLNPYTIAIVIAIEGSASGFLCSYLTMQWLKRDIMSETHHRTEHHTSH